MAGPDGSRLRSVACLAACKADVDNLGLLFGMGFAAEGKQNLFSISRFAMLSRMLNHFFAAHVPRLMQREFPGMYLIFAGGDDLFALGPWSEAVRFAQRLRSDFGRFTGNNPALTFSAGLPVFKPRLPMRALRHAAEEALTHRALAAACWAMRAPAANLIRATCVRGSILRTWRMIWRATVTAAKCRRRTVNVCSAWGKTRRNSLARRCPSHGHCTAPASQERGTQYD